MAITSAINPMVKSYWQGVWETCAYFRDELGIEDATETAMALQAIEVLGLTGDE